MYCSSCSVLCHTLVYALLYRQVNAAHCGVFQFQCRADTNQDGFITATEWKTYSWKGCAELTEAQAKEQIQKADTNGDGKVDYVEMDLLPSSLPAFWSNGKKICEPINSNDPKFAFPDRSGPTKGTITDAIDGAARKAQQHWEGHEAVPTETVTRSSSSSSTSSSSTSSSSSPTTGSACRKAQLVVNGRIPHQEPAWFDKLMSNIIGRPPQGTFNVVVDYNSWRKPSYRSHSKLSWDQEDQWPNSNGLHLGETVYSIQHYELVSAELSLPQHVGVGDDELISTIDLELKLTHRRVENASLLACEKPPTQK